jgi:UDPglucose 6-dehydrogenase
MKRNHEDVVSVFGLGPVGLVTAVCIAKRGYRVIGIDPDTQKLKKVRKSESPFFEPDLRSLLNDTIKAGTLTVSDTASSNSEATCAYVAVGTPSREDGSIDLKNVEQAAISIGQTLRNIRHYQLVIVKSTVTPGTARNVVKPILERESGKRCGREFGLCSNPEFLREGNAIRDTYFPDRIIIGGEDTRAIKSLEEFCRRFHGRRTPPIVKTTYENAELIKYSNNAFLATKVSFINTVASICERSPGADIQTISVGIGLDERVGPSFLNAGFGWGGSCFPKDLNALVSYSESLSCDTALLRATIAINKGQWVKAVQLARNVLGSLKGKKIAVLGLAFKPNTDDMRDAVSVSIIEGLLAEGANVIACDPAALRLAQSIFEDKIAYTKDPLECIDQADCCIIVTEWNQFRKIPPETFVRRMRRPVLIDGRRIYDAEKFMKAGIRFRAIGLGPETSGSSMSARVSSH